jgi:hypothetical protein
MTRPPWVVTVSVSGRRPTFSRVMSASTVAQLEKVRGVCQTRIACCRACSVLAT